jgi:hypothetical protein
MAWDPSVPALTEWVAVLRVADNADELDGEATAEMERVPGQGLFGLVDAHEGLAERLGVRRGTWVSGVVAETRQDMETALARALGGRREPLVVGEFRVLWLSK